MERQPRNPRLLTLSALHRNIYGDSDGAKKLLLFALELASEDDSRQIQFRLASLCFDLAHYREAADLLGELIGGAATHPAATFYLMCLVRSEQFRQALDWTRSIRAINCQPSKLVIEAEAMILAYVGDVRAAVSCLEEICSAEDSSPTDKVRLALAQFRCGDRNAALKTVERANSTELRQDPKSLLDLARLQVVLGADGALNSAYLARRHGIDDPATHTGYMEVFQGGERALAEPEVVGPGTAICLRSDSTARWWYVLDQDEQSLSGNEVPATSELARKLVGHRVGDSVVLRQDLEDLSYQIIEIQSKYVRAYQESIEEFFNSLS